MSQMPGQTPPSTPPSTPPPPPQMPYDPNAASNERMFAMLCHLAALAGYVLPGVGSIVGPLVVWMMKREQYPLVDDQGKEALNFQISMMIYAAICGVLILAVIGIVLLPLLLVFNIVMIIIAAVKANNGERYRYPLTIRLIK